MLNGLRLVGMVGILLTVVLTAALQRSQFANELSLEMEEIWENLMHDLRGGQPSAKRVPDYQFFTERSAEKRRVARAVLAGEFTLFEAAVLFRRLNEEFPTVMACTYAPDCSEEERLCLSVIDWVRSYRIELGVDAVEAACALLEGQLRQHKELHGKVLLPQAVAGQN